MLDVFPTKFKNISTLSFKSIFGMAVSFTKILEIQHRWKKVVIVNCVFIAIGGRRITLSFIRCDQALATHKIFTRRDASIEKINKIWAVHFRP